MVVNGTSRGISRWLFTIYDLKRMRALRGGMWCVLHSTREGTGWMRSEKILLGHAWANVLVRYFSYEASQTMELSAKHLIRA